MSCVSSTSSTAMSPKLILTRYLYVKDEVMFSLWKALLFKKDDEAKFWCYELYYSGFKEETFVFLLQIYYDFYAMHNPRLEVFLLRTINEWLKNKKKDWIPGAIVENLLQRSSTTESFVLQHLVDKETYANHSIRESNLYPDLLRIVKSQTEVEFIDWFLEDTNYKLKENIKEKIDDIILLLTKLLPNKNETTTRQMVNMGKSAAVAYLLGSICQLPKDPRFYLVLDNEMIAHYKTVLHVPSKGRYVLKRSQLYSPDIECMSLFDFSRKEQTKPEFYDMLNKWMYYASFSPIWSQRIVKHNGVVNHHTKNTDFANDDDLEEFYSYFGYDLDEEHPDFRPPPPESFYDNPDILEHFEKVSFGDIAVGEVGKTKVKLCTNIPYFANSE